MMISEKQSAEQRHQNQQLESTIRELKSVTQRQVGFVDGSNVVDHPGN
jgi:hypothetical protein